MNSELKAVSAGVSRVSFLKHFVFWPGFSLELFSQFLFLPAVWFILKLVLFHWDKFDPNHPALPTGAEFLIPILLFLVSCIRLVSVFGYWNPSLNLMRVYCVSTVIWFTLNGLLVHMIASEDSAIVIDLFQSVTCWLLVLHFALALYLLFKMSNHAATKRL